MKTVSTSRVRNTNFFRSLFVALIAAVAFTVSASALSIKIEMGRASQDCTGFGICSITIDLGITPNSAFADGVLHGDQLTLSFQQPFGQPGQVLPIDQPIQLDPQTARALGAGSVVILPGAYTVDYGTNPNGVVTLPVQRVGITINIEVGRRSRGCTGFGICSITIEAMSTPNTAQADGVLNGDQLTLSFARPFGQSGEALVIDEPIELDPQTAQALGAAQVVVRPGQYTVDYGTNPNGVVTLPVQRVGITIIVDLGRRSEGCTGFGICNIIIDINLAQHPVPTVGTLDGDQLTLSFMQPFGQPGQVLPIDEPIVLDPQTAWALGAAQVVVQPGQYTVDYSTNPNGTVTLPVQRVGISIYVENGRRSKGCTKFGICSITIDIEFMQRPIPTVVTVNGDVLTLDFMKPMEEREDTIVIDEDIVPDSATSRVLGIEQRVVKAGSYPVDYSVNPNGTVRVTTEPVEPAGLTIHVKIGLRSLGCRGFGICDIWTTPDAMEKTAPAFGKLNGNTLSIDFQSQLDEQGSALVIDEPVELDEETSLALGARKVVLLPGTYPVDYSKNPNGSVEVTVGRVGITIGIDIGRRSTGCTGLGICRIWIDVDLRQGMTPTVASLKDSTLTLLFTSELPEGGDTFSIDEDFELDAQVARMLGAKGLTIRKGSYVIRRDAKGRPYVELPVAKVGITVTIYIGYGASCTGFGICRITIETNFTARTVQAIATTSNGLLELDFLTESPDRGNAMSLDHGITLDSATAAALGFGEILPGEYVVDYSTNANGVVRLRTDNSSSSVAPEAVNGAGKAQAFPNPTSGSTTLHFNVRRTGPVVITLADARGDVVTRLVETTMETGEHSVNFDAATLADGVYFYTVSTVTGTESGRMMVMRR